MQNQSTISNSIFKMPPTPQPVETLQPQNHQIESLLFNDIVEELNTAVRDKLAQFLPLQPYRKFSKEFEIFMNRITRLMQEGQQQGTNISRFANSTQTLPINYGSSLSFNYKKPANTMISYNNNTLKLPENNVQPAEPINPFKPPTCVNLNSIVSLSRIDQSINSPQNISNMLYTTRPSIAETKVSLPSNSNPPEPAVTEQSKSSNNNSNSVESLLENVGFKIIVGLPENNDNTTKTSNTTQHQLTLIQKYLSKWSINLKEITTPMDTSKFVLFLTGTLLSEDQTTVIEKRHNAGILETRKNNNLVKTNNGIYCLIGNIVGGSSNELYQIFLTANGIPRTWRSIINKLSNADKGTKNTKLNIVLDSPAQPFKSMKNLNMDISMTRGGKNFKSFNPNPYSINHDIQKINGKRKSSESDPSGSNISKHSKIPALDTILASTPKRPKKQASTLETPSQILKKKLVENINKKKGRKINKINDSIDLIRERKSSGKKQVKSPVKTVKSTTTSKQSSVNNSKVLNSVNNTKQSTSKTSVNSTRTMYSVNSSKQKSLNNSTKSSIGHSKLSISESKEKSQDSKKPNIKTKSQKVSRIATPQLNKLNPVKKNYINSSKNSSNKVGQVKKSKIINSDKENPHGSSPTLFGNLDFETDFGDMSNFNLIPSPSPLNVTPCTDKSRSETPPLIYDWWASSKSVVISEPPTPLSKSNECNQLKRIKAPKITLEEEIKKVKKNHKKIDYKTAANTISRMLQYDCDEDDD